MEYKVTKKQHNSKRCFVCGLKNESGLKANFYELENNEIVAKFQPLQEHQSYPARLHGGIAGAILDETIGRAIMTKDENLFGITVELNLRFKKPVPLDQELRVTGRITKDSRLLFEGTGEIILPNGDVAVTAQGKYLKVSMDKMPEFDVEEQEWKITSSNKDPAIIDI
jgi:acyl-coenzyme A thioesterase PaaI-like protein